MFQIISQHTLGVVVVFFFFMFKATEAIRLVDHSLKFLSIEDSMQLAVPSDWSPFIFYNHNSATIT